jgi:hypothetical protein
LNARSLAIRYYTQTGQEALETVEVAVVEATEEEE